eukprot:961996-Amphidinium_carterae.1
MAGDILHQLGRSRRNQCQDQGPRSPASFSADHDDLDTVDGQRVLDDIRILAEGCFGYDPKFCCGVETHSAEEASDSG